MIHYEKRKYLKTVDYSYVLILSRVLRNRSAEFDGLVIYIEIFS